MADPQLHPVDEIAEQAPDQLVHGKTFEARHNATAYLVIDNATQANRVFTPVIQFFQRSRIAYALSVPVDAIYENHMLDFWATAEYHCDMDPPCITASVDNQDFVLTEEMIRDVLHFEDSLNVSNDISRQIIDACLQDMGSIRPMNDPQIRKNHVCPQWKFLEHTLIGCLSAWKAGLDGMSYQLVGLMVAFIQNRPYNFSHFVFSNLVSNINSNTSFYMCPRFLQRIFDERIENLHREGDVFHYIPMQKRVFKDCLGYQGKPVPPTTALFGHIIDVNFLPPQIEINMSSEDEEEEEHEHVENVPVHQEAEFPHVQQDLDDIEQYHDIEELVHVVAENQGDPPLVADDLVQAVSTSISST